MPHTKSNNKSERTPVHEYHFSLHLAHSQVLGVYTVAQLN